MANYKIYMIDGEAYEVAEEKEEQFLSDMKAAGKNPILQSEDLDVKPEFTLDVKESIFDVLDEGREPMQMYDQDKHFQESSSHPLYNPQLDKIERTSLFNLDTKDILSSEVPNAIEELEHVFGKGDNALYDFKRRGNIVDITHKESGEKISVPFDITMESFDDDNYRSLGGELPMLAWAENLFTSKEEKEKYYKDKLEKNSNDLFEFFNSTLTGDEEEIVRNNQNNLIKWKEDEMAPGGLFHIPSEEFEAIDNRYNKEANPDLFKKESVKKRKGNIMIQPHEEELQQALSWLTQNNPGETPSQEKIEEVARQILINKDKDELWKDKINRVMNSDEIEEIPGMTSKVKIASDLYGKRKARELAVFEQMNKTYQNNYLQSDEVKRINDFWEIINSPEELEIEKGVETVELKNGKVIPKELYDQYEVDLATAKGWHDKYNDWADENNKVIEDLSDSEFKNNLIQRNYNDWDKFFNNISTGFGNIFTQAAYMMTKAGSSLLGQEETQAMKALDEAMIDRNEMQRIYDEQFQPDIKFEDAFDSGFNFSKYSAQVIGDQLPIYASLATGGPGIALVATSSAGENWTRMVEEDAMYGSDTSTLKKFATSAGYGALEFIPDFFITAPLMNRAFKGLSGSRRSLSEGWDGFKEYSRKHALKDFTYTPLSEVFAESLTGVGQNIITGRPVLENLPEMAYNGLFFGKMMGDFAFGGGLMLNAFSDSKTKQQWRDNQTKINELSMMLDEAGGDLLLQEDGNYVLKPKEEGKEGPIDENVQDIADQIAELQGENETIINQEAERALSISSEFGKHYLHHFNEAERIRRKAKEINKSSLPKKTKEKLIDNLQLELDSHNRVLDALNDPDAFGTKYAGFMASEEAKDVERREEILQEAIGNLMSGKTVLGGKNTKPVSEPNDEEIREEARLIYNLQEIRSDLAKIRKAGGFKKPFTSYKTKESAIEGINKRDDLTQERKDKLIEGIEGGYLNGANMDDWSFQVEENMANNDRTETRTHEQGHAWLEEAIGRDPEAFAGIAEQIIHYVRDSNPALHLELLTRVKGPLAEGKIDEVLTEFMEMVVEGKFDSKDSRTKSSIPLLGWMFNHAQKEATDSNYDFDFAGETDAVNFVKGLAKKIKAGTISFGDVKAMRESKVTKEARELGKKSKKKGDDIKESRHPNLDKLGKVDKSGTNWTNNTWEERGANQAIKFIKKDPWMRAIIKNKHKLAKMDPAKVPTTFVDDIIGSRYFINMITRFNRDRWGNKTGKNKENESLFAFINNELRWRADDVWKQMEQGKAPLGTLSTDARTPDGALIVQPSDTDTRMERFDEQDLSIRKREDEVQLRNRDSKIEKSKLRRELGIKVKGKTEIKDKVRTALLTSKSFNEQGFLRDFEKNLSNLIEPTVAKLLNDPSKLKKYRKGILESIPVKTLVQMQKFLPENIFVENHGRVSNKEVLSDFVHGKNQSGKNPRKKKLLDEELLNEENPESKRKRKAGIQVYERLDTTTDQFEKYIDAPTKAAKTGKRSGTRGNNRAKIISEVSKALGRDATPETLTPEFVKDYLYIKDIKGDVTFGKVKEKIAEQIDRPVDLKFSVSPRISNMLNVQDNFYIEAKGKNIVLNMHEVKDAYDLKTEDGIKQFINEVQTTLLPLMPRDFWFGKPDSKGNFGTVFTPSSKVIGDSKNPVLKQKYKDLYNNIFVPEIKKLRDLPDSSFYDADKFKKKYGIKNFSISSYSTIFKDPDTITKNKENGKIKEWNNKVGVIHRAMWDSFNESIGQNKDNARVIANYLGMVGADSSHWHKLGAQFAGHSTKITKRKKGESRYEYEHAMPATAAYLYLLDSALRDGINFDVAYELLMDNYKLIALDKAMDDKLTNAKTKSGYSLQKRMPDGWSVIDSKWWERYFNETVGKIDGGINPSSIVALDGKTFAETLNINADGNLAIVKKSTSEIKNIYNAKKAKDNTFKYSKSGKAVGMSTFDFDETLIIDGENFVVATDPKTGEKINIKSGDWPVEGPKLAEQGFEFNFDDFVNVRGGVEGPLLDKMRNQIKKYGAKNVFVLTARPQNADVAIHEWLKSKGIKIPFKNITGLADSRGEAKADWMLEKFAEGYNDMYFVDDALSNVDAVKEVLGQLDIKSKVVQAKTKVKVGPWLIDTTTKEGRDFIKQYNEIETVSTTDPHLANRKIKFSKRADKIADTFNQQMKTWREGEGKAFYEEMKKIPTVSSSEFKRIGAWIIDTRTEEGRKFVRDFENIPTVSSSDPDRVTKFSKSPSVEFNEMLNRVKGIDAKKVFSASEAREVGKNKGKNLLRNFFVPPSAEDFKGLLYSFLGRGKEGDTDFKFFKDKLLKPFAKGIRDWNSYKQNMANEYEALKKEFPEVGKRLRNKAEGTPFTNEDAIRVYLWDKAGFDIPGLFDNQIEDLVEHVENDPELKAFAEGLSIVSRGPEGYIKPNETWVAESIGSDLNNAVDKIGRADFLREWIENKNEIFSPENLNKIEAIYGKGFREALENMLHRMETGKNRIQGKDKIVNWFLDWVNGSVGAVMFVNVRSAVLQTISTVNFINWADNNIFKAAAAFANQPQFWKDFSFIFNSDMLKQRRAGLQIDVSANELTKAFKDGKSRPQAIIHYLLEKGFLPTQAADSFAIAMGGATFYRNRLNTYLKQGLSETKAKEKAWLDFQEIAEETQQSSRPDLISMQQAGTLGRILLAWQNTPMQMTRLTKKALSDLINRRGDTKQNVSRIIYYGVIQNLIFGALQTGLAFMMFGWDEDEEKKKKLEQRVANGALDTILRGTGIYGAMISTLKNTLMKWQEESKKGWKREDSNIIVEAINLSPPIGSKVRKLHQAIKTEKYNKGVSKEIGLRIENPNLNIAANWIEALTNAPVARIVNKANNVEEALTGNHDAWQRAALLGGWSKWSVGVKDEELEAAKEEAKQQREEKRKIEREEKKEQKKKDEEREKKEKGIKTVRCSGIKSDGNRCSLTTETDKKTWKCMHHMKFKDGMDRDNDGIKEYRCTAITASGVRCKNKGEYTGKIKKCYAHK